MINFIQSEASALFLSDDQRKNSGKTSNLRCAAHFVLDKIGILTHDIKSNFLRATILNSIQLVNLTSSSKIDE